MAQDFFSDRRTQLDGRLFPMRDPAVALDLERLRQCLKRRQGGAQSVLCLLCRDLGGARLDELLRRRQPVALTGRQAFGVSAAADFLGLGRRAGQKLFPLLPGARHILVALAAHVVEIERRRRTQMTGGAGLDQTAGFFQGHVMQSASRCLRWQ
jgi:hypothetical protein